MADKKITQLTELTDIADDDFLAVVDTSGAATKKIRKDNLFAGFLPTAAIMAYGGASEPDGWLICNGQAVNRTTYAALFTAIGTLYGAGDGSTTFNLPDLRGKVPVGLDASDASFDTLGETGGEKNHTLTSAEMPSHSHGVSQSPHSHGVNDPGHRHSLVGKNQEGFDQNQRGTEWAPLFENGGTNSVQPATTGISISGANANISIANAGSGQAHNNLQPYQVMNFIIKT